MYKLVSKKMQNEIAHVCQLAIDTRITTGRPRKNLVRVIRKENKIVKGMEYEKSNT